MYKEKKEKVSLQDYKFQLREIRNECKIKTHKIKFQFVALVIITYIVPVFACFDEGP